MWLDRKFVYLTVPAMASIDSDTIKNCDSNDSGDDGVVSDMPSDQILDQCDDLISRTRNFNLHAKVLKRLLNLKERKSGYDLYQKPKCDDSNTNEIKSDKSPGPDCSVLLTKINDLRKEVEESHMLGFCLAYNIQCLQKKITGTPIDINSGACMIKDLQEKYDKSNNRNAVMKYEFQEKRKLLRRLRKQLEDTRGNWCNLPIHKRRPDSADNIILSEALRRNFANKSKQPSQESGFIEPGKDSSDEGCNSSSENTSSSSSSGLEDLVMAMDLRQRRIEILEDECFNLFSSLANRSDVIKNDYDNSSGIEMADDILDLDEEEDEDLTDPLSEEFDDVIDGQFSIDVIDPLEVIENAEEVEVSDLPWDLNLFNQSRHGSNAGQTTVSAASTIDVSSQTAEVVASINPGASELDLDNDDELTQQDMESMAETMAETGEPLMLCRLRRRAVEILISRLRDEKTLQSELKEQLEAMRVENERLRAQLNDSRIASKIFRHKKILLTVITSLIVTCSIVTALTNSN